MNTKDKAKYSFLLPFLLCFSTLFMCIGYAAINSISSEIKGVAIATPQDGIFITDVTYGSANITDIDPDLARSNIEGFYQTLLRSTIALSSNPNSTITYTITIYNKTNQEYIYEGYNYGEDFYDNENIEFSLTGLETGDKILGKETKTFAITFNYIDKENISNNILNSHINFIFKQVYKVEYNNINADSFPTEATEGTDISVTLPYDTSDYIKVIMGETLLILDEDYTYNTTTKKLTVKNISDNVYIEYTYTRPSVDLYNNTLTPVVYDTNHWEVADTNSIWYDYDNQQWANAVILKSGVTKNIGDTVTVEGNNQEVLAMFVWIPRYEYKIDGTYGTHTDGTDGTETNPGEINVNFLPVSQKTVTDGYRIHPAFTFNNKTISGIWVGKFETSHSTLATSTTEDNLECTNENCSSADGLIILPNVNTLGYNNVSNFFYAARSMSRNNNPFGIDSNLTDTHMMKNSEWGAVAYLTQSQYGKYGNPIYSGTNREIYQNKSLITGNSNGTPSQDDAIETQCNYNDITDRGSGTGSCGGGASTTGNIYGIYDLSGSSNEYVMGYLTTASSTWGSTSGDDYAKFASEPASKYFDSYTSTTSSSACNGSYCYGHALDEVSGWYGDSVNFISEGSPWTLRGGGYDRGTITGIFYYSRTNGKNSATRGFRVVLSNP